MCEGFLTRLRGVDGGARVARMCELMFLASKCHSLRSALATDDR